MKRMFLRLSADNSLVIISTLFLVIFLIAVLYPFVYTINLSLSDSDAALGGGLFLFPRGFDLSSYRTVLGSRFIWSGYVNSVFVTLLGTFFQVFCTALTAYPLSKKRMKGQRFMNGMVVFSMLFNGGIIPTFLVVKATGLLDTHLSLILPILISPFNVIVLRSFFARIPGSLEESAKMDGANDLGIFFAIIIPLSKAALATIALWCAVFLWNDFFNALIYLQNRARFVLPLILREIIASANLTDLDLQGDDMLQITAETIKAAAIVVVTVPILLVYPFIQKYFVKGALIGSVKG